MVTEIKEGPQFIHHIDLYSNYSGNYILIYPSWYWVSKQFFGKSKSNGPNWRESCSVIPMMSRGVAISNLFALQFSAVCFSPALTAAASGILKSKNVTSLHHRWRNTVHDLRTRDARVWRALQSVVGVTALCNLHQILLLSYFPALSLLSGVFDMITFVWDRILRPRPPKSPPIHRMLIAPLLCKDQRA